MSALPSSSAAASKNGRLLSRLIWVVTIAVTTLSVLFVSFWVRMNPDLVALLPRRGDSGALAKYIHAFGGGGLSVILVEGPDGEKNGALAEQITAELKAKETVAFAADRIKLPTLSKVDPLILFRYADADARERLTQALTPEGMRTRLRETKTMLLAPGAGAMKEFFVSDPLRLSQVIFEGGAEGGGVKARSDGAFATEDGSAHLVVVKPRGQALRGADARAFMSDVDSVLEPLKKQNRDVTIGITGPHAIAAATEALVKDDLATSGVLSLVLASVVFVAIFRRVRTLLAITPPLVLGTLWTAALASLWPHGISAIAMAFASVVVGVGFDTGVHVYQALLDARREGLSPQDAARAARQRTMRPVLVAAVIAGFAFATLSLSSVEAVGQLGILCGAGEVLTAVAIVALTPEIGALIERGKPPSPVATGWTTWIHSLTRTKTRAAVAMVLAIGAAFSWVPLHLGIADSVIAIRPKNLAPLDVEAKIFAAFGGKPQPWIVMVADKDLDEAMHRADRIAEALKPNREDIERVDSLTPFVPSVATQKERLAFRDQLLVGKPEELEKALSEVGFKPALFRTTIEAMRAPSQQVAVPEEVLQGDVAVLGARYLAQDGDEHLAILNVNTSSAPGARERMEKLVKEVDPKAVVTGYARLEADLHDALRTDMPLIGGVAFAIVLAMLAISLRRVREVAIAMSVLMIGIGSLLGFIALFKIPMHIYSALVVPVLLGITVDEAMFLLHHARDGGSPKANGEDPMLATLREEGPPVLATALTTSAGFAALGFAKYSALRDLGIVGAMGSAAGLVVALVIVPAGLRLMTPTSRAPKPE